MRTMERLCKYFNKVYDYLHYYAELDKFNSEAGNYVVVVADPMGNTARYHFSSAENFRNWIDGVVLD